MMRRSLSSSQLSVFLLLTSSVTLLLLRDPPHHGVAVAVAAFVLPSVVRQQQRLKPKTPPARSTTRLGVFAAGGPTIPPAVEIPAPRILVEQQQQQQQPQSPQQSPVVDVRYSDFLQMVRDDRVAKVSFDAAGTRLRGVTAEDDEQQRMMRFQIPALPNDPELLTFLTKHNVDVTVQPAGQGASGGAVAAALAFPVALFAGLFFLGRQASGGGNGSNNSGSNRNSNKNLFNFGQSPGQLHLIPDTGVTFGDVAGCDQAKLELAEVVDFLQQPEAYTKNGCKIPRGVILDGPPGTGKTLLAKAVAGEAGVPFISAAGSEFVEMFVGVGASRVRDIFAQARAVAPCIVFIDEIDAVARQRGSTGMGGSDEREQTVNQILVEMDGFQGNPGVITVAATNRVDILDQALLRPGRFDRKITVSLPDFQGRARILEVHARGKPLEPDVDLEAVARRTPGFSGAQLENLMNEAAIASARLGKVTIGWEQIDAAVDRVMVGLEKKGGSAQAKQKQLVAYHEAGHAIVGALVPDYDQVQKISIIPRSNGAGGLTFFAPHESRLESGMYSKQYLESQLAVALGGRLAEEIVYGEDMVTTGASNDIQQVASIAKRMVKEWGMSDKVGRVALSTPPGQGRLAMGSRGGMAGALGYHQGPVWGNKILGTVEEEVERLVNNSYLVAKKVLNENRELLEHLTEALMEREVVSAEEFQMMLVQFKARTIDYNVLGDDTNRDKLPFQDLPESM